MTDEAYRHIQSIEATVKKNSERLFDLRERYLKTNFATDHLLSELSRRVEKLEIEATMVHAKRLSEVREEIARLKAIDEVRYREEATGAHKISVIRDELLKERENGRKTLMTALDAHKSLIQVLLTIAAVISAVVHWLIQ